MRPSSSSSSSSVGIVFAVLGLALNAAVLCNGGITSSFVRKAEKSVDMPLDSDVFAEPPGYNAPQQVNFSVFFSLWFVYQFIDLVGFVDYTCNRLNPSDTLLFTILPFFWVEFSGSDLSFCCFCYLIFGLSLFKVHITQGDHSGKAVIVSWVTMAEPGSNTVLYWSEKSKVKMQAEASVVTYKYYNYASGYIHHCTIRNLEVGFRPIWSILFACPINNFPCFSIL